MRMKIVLFTISMMSSSCLFAAAAKPEGEKRLPKNWILKTIKFGLDLKKNSETCTFELSTVYDANEKSSVKTASGSIQPSLWDQINEEICRGELPCSNPNHGGHSHTVNKAMKAHELMVSIPE